MPEHERPPLTLLQWRILALVAGGADDRAIAEVLLTSRSAIQHRLGVIYALLHMEGVKHPRTAVAVWYLREGQRWHEEALRDA